MHIPEELPDGVIAPTVMQEQELYLRSCDES